MTAEERAQVARRVLARSQADATEVTVTAGFQGLTRFTREAVTHNIDRTERAIRIRAIVDGRIGIAATNAFDDAALDVAVRRAAEIARFAPRESIPPQLAHDAVAAAATPAYVAATAAATPAERARLAAAMFAHAATNELWSSGYATTAHDGTTIVNSNGVCASFDGTDAGANIKMNATDATGFAEAYSPDVDVLDGDAIGLRAAGIALRTRRPIGVEPGDWTVILSPAAAGELLRFVTQHFSAETYSDGSSFISGKLGTAVVGSNVTILDDCTHALNPGMPFDAQAVSKQRIELVRNGVATDIVTDSTWAARLNRRNTGHALPAPNVGGPQSNSTVVEPGPKSLETLVAETQRGLLITRLWYVRSVDQRTLLLTGMTRDGTFLIENGKLQGGVHNMRFNASMIAALADCELADTQMRTGGYHYSLVTPAIKFPRFHFASASPY